MIHVGVAVANGMLKPPVPSMLWIQSEVREAFGWSEDDDLKSAEGLKQALSGHSHWNFQQREATLSRIREKLRGAEHVVVLGAAVEQTEIEAWVGRNAVFVAADGAVGVLESYKQLACIVSDFDGAIHLDTAAREGQDIVAHAHGDNLPQWSRALSLWQQYPLPPHLVLSHQVSHHIPEMYNFGGFTDGDRALCFVLANDVPAEKIAIVGFSTGKIGAWSATTIPAQKLKKLEWMRRIVSELGFGDSIQT